MRRPVPAVALVTALVPLLVAGCGTDSRHPSAGGAVAAARTVGGIQEVTIHAGDALRFDPARITAHPGMLRIVLDDPGAYPHNISFPKLGRTSQTVSGSPGRGSTSLTVTLPRPGTYTFVCTFHDSAGMTGEVRVTG